MPREKGSLVSVAAKSTNEAGFFFFSPQTPPPGDELMTATIEFLAHTESSATPLTSRSGSHERGKINESRGVLDSTGWTAAILERCRPTLPCCVQRTAMSQTSDAMKSQACWPLTQHNGPAGEKVFQNSHAIDAIRRSCPNGASCPFPERLWDPPNSVRMGRQGNSVRGLHVRLIHFKDQPISSKLCAAYCGTTPVDPCSTRTPLRNNDNSNSWRAARLAQKAARADHQQAAAAWDLAQLI